MRSETFLFHAGACLLVFALAPRAQEAGSEPSKNDRCCIPAEIRDEPDPSLYLCPLDCSANCGVVGTQSGEVLSYKDCDNESNKFCSDYRQEVNYAPLYQCVEGYPLPECAPGETNCLWEQVENPPPGELGDIYGDCTSSEDLCSAP